jgi:sec-independent protein translocase protein TatC
MNLINSNYQTHFFELKKILLKVVIFFLAAMLLSYINKEILCEALIKPLVNIKLGSTKIIYTAITEAFIAYLDISCFFATALTIPFFSYQIYRFIAPALYKDELNIARIILILAPFLFILACSFVYFLVMPNAWGFFLSFDSIGSQELFFEAKIGQYLSFIINLMLVFGIAFELPVILIILFLLKIISLQGMIEKRRISIVLNFIIAGIITPPDVVSQLALALPMCALYEMTIMICKNINNKGITK